MPQTYIPTNLAGGFTYTPVSYTYGQTSQSIAGGFGFDLPLSTVAAFTNSALSFTSDNSSNARGFLQGVISGAQSNVSATSNRSFTLQQQALTQQNTQYMAALDVQRYAIKKKYDDSFCFITTAVTSSQGKPDDCEELQVLRKFRDEVLKTTEEGQALVQAYYFFAPKIVEGLGTLANSGSVYNYLFNTFIRQAIQAVSRGDDDQARDFYTTMVHVAANLAGVSLEPVQTAEVEPIEKPFHPLGD